MRNKNNIYLLALLVTIFLVFGCNLFKKRNTNVANTNAATPSPTNTPSLADDLFQLDGKKEELAKFTAPVKLDPKAKVKGKVAIVVGEDDYYYTLEGTNYSDFDEEELKGYGLTKDDAASKIEEIDTLVQTNCKKGKQIGTYKITDGRVIPAYALNCETLVIDYKAPAVFAKKSFYSDDLSDNIEVSSTTDERTAYRPTEQIQKFIKNLREK